MKAVMVDTCVLLDVITEDATWFTWSEAMVRRAAEEGTLVINPVIYAELSVGFARIEDMEDLLTPDLFDYRPIPREAAFLAGKSFLEYRRRGGVRAFPLPDFFIGAHASVEDLPLVTRDAGRFKTYFPRLTLICP
ncbi:MAG: type II toxin-antitoxin system VapC family toxin [Lentisphaerae bacterium]|nr:type II toxin-antitoxin system VapC family toxin [Lentisphaerota bacterium]